MRPDVNLTADAHLRDRRGDEFFAFEQIVDEAIKDKAPLIAAGDMLDRQSNRAKVIAFFCRQLDRLEEAGLPFYYIEGQHDLDDPPWFSAHRAAEHIHRKKIEIGDWVIYGLNWQPFGKLQEELAEIPKDVNLLICHQVWADWMGSVTSPQGEFAQIPGHVTHVFTGDLHEWKLERCKNADGKKMIVCSPGATTQQKIDEPYEHFFAKLHPGGQFLQTRLRSRAMIDWSIMSRTEDVDAFVAEIDAELSVAEQRAAKLDLPKELAKPYLRYTYSARLGDVVRRVEKAVKDRAILFPKETIPEEKVVEYEKVKKAVKGEAVTPLSVLGQEVNKDENPAVYELVEKVLSATDPEQAFAAWRSDYMGDSS